MGNSPGLAYRSHFRRTVLQSRASCGTSRVTRLFTANPASDRRLLTVSGADSRQTFRVRAAARKLVYWSFGMRRSGVRVSSRLSVAHELSETAAIAAATWEATFALPFARVQLAVSPEISAP